MNGSKPRPLDLVLLVAILALAALLRIGWPGITEFKGDEARIALLALDLVEGKAFPLKGTGTSVGLQVPSKHLSLCLALSVLAQSPRSQPVHGRAEHSGSVPLLVAGPPLLGEGRGALCGPPFCRQSLGSFLLAQDLGAEPVAGFRCGLDALRPIGFR